MTDIIPVLDVVERMIARLVDGVAAFLLAGSTSAGWTSIAS
jgi:hypothetical protein